MLLIALPCQFESAQKSLLAVKVVSDTDLQPSTPLGVAPTFVDDVKVVGCGICGVFVGIGSSRGLLSVGDRTFG